MSNELKTFSKFDFPLERRSEEEQLQTGRNLYLSKTNCFVILKAVIKLYLLKYLL